MKPFSIHFEPGSELSLPIRAVFCEGSGAEKPFEITDIMEGTPEQVINMVTQKLELLLNE